MSSLELLTRNEIDAVTPVLTDLIARAGGRNWFIGALLPSAFLSELSVVAPHTASDDLVAAAALQICITKEWPEQPGQACWLELLLTAVAAQALTVVPNLTSTIIPRVQRHFDLESYVRVFADSVPAGATFAHVCVAQDRETVAVLLLSNSPR